MKQINYDEFVLKSPSQREKILVESINNIIKQNNNIIVNDTKVFIKSCVYECENCNKCIEG